MSKCYLCGEKLTDNNKSLEHIIPNALGGKLKSKEILCRACNNAMADIDSNLVKFFDFANVMVNPKRDRNNTRQFQAKIDGQDILVKSCNEITTPFKPTITQTENGKNIEFMGSFTSQKDEEIFFKKAQKCVNGLSKDKQYTLDEIKASAKVEIKRPIIYHQFKISLNDLFLGYLKILLGFCAFKDKIQYIDPKTITFLKEQNFREIECISTLCECNIFNSNKSAYRIYLIGNQNTKKLFGLVSIYACCAIFILNDDYRGENFRENYCYDIYQGKEIDTNLEMNLDIEKYYFTILYNNAKQVTDILLKYIRKITANIARKTKRKLSITEFNSKLCEMLCSESKHNLELAMLLQNEQIIRDLIMNKIGFYALYNIVCDNPTMPIN